MDEECWDPGRTPAPAPRERWFTAEAQVACPLCSLSWPLIALGGLDPKLCEARCCTKGPGFRDGAVSEVLR